MNTTKTHIHQLKNYLMSKGLKFTQQRHVILDVFLKTKDHVDIETLYNKVKVKDPNVGYATVYRTMKLLKDSGIASERHFGTRHAVYEPHIPDAHHDHLICEKCNAIIEFEDKRIEILQNKVAKKHSFTLTTHKHELYGLCQDCRD